MGDNITTGPQRAIELGLRQNWLQFTLLVIVNVCVGGLVGLERTTVPLIGADVFGITSDLAVFSFIIAFGVTKALTNLAAGALTSRFRRKQLLVAGWAVGVPVPFMLAWGPSWWWIVAANVLLGLNQGLAWSMTVNMKIDLVGPRQRGLVRPRQPHRLGQPFAQQVRAGPFVENFYHTVIFVT